MSYVLTFLGFAALIILHEAGHFVAAKAVGMRVERFSLFFGRTPLTVRRGETEYGIGWLPAGGYVKITGMNPHEELTPELVPRAYYNQPPWKRIVVILAGPAVNFLIAFLILFGIFLSNNVQVYRDGQPVFHEAFVYKTIGQPAKGVLKPGDQIIAVDGHPVETADQVGALVDRYSCGPTVAASRCLVTQPVHLQIRRAGALQTFVLRARYNAKAKRPLVGITLEEANPVTRSLNVFGASGHSISEMWSVTSTTASKIAQLFKASDRRQIHGIVGSVSVTEQAFSYDATAALSTLALISMSLAVVNLFPFLPLDGGHVFWAVAEKVRGRAIPFETMERAGIVGFVLILILFVIGLSNDISTLSGNGFNIR